MQLKEFVKKLPNNPGVYFFKKGKEILYIGRATSLKSRVNSYFDKDLIQTRGPLIVGMVEKANKIDFQEVDSVLEAIILEAELIKQYQPIFNTKEKDNKSFNYVAITNESFPRVITVRGREVFNLNNKDKYLEIFGPYPSAKFLKDALKIVRKIFPYRDRCMPLDPLDLSKDLFKSQIKSLARGKSLPRPCFNRQIGLCPGVCTGEITAKEYSKTIQNIKLFFEGKKSKLINKLTSEMKALAKTRSFEQAEQIKRKIFALEHINDVAFISEGQSNTSYKEEKQKVERIEAYDIAHISGTSVVGVMTVIAGGIPDKSQYRKFKIKTAKGGNDIQSLAEVILRRIKHLEWPKPEIVVIDGGEAQLNIGLRLFKNVNWPAKVVSVVKDDRHKAKDILGSKDFNFSELIKKQIILANSEAHRFAIKYHKFLRDRI